MFLIMSAVIQIAQLLPHMLVYCRLRKFRSLRLLLFMYLTSASFKISNSPLERKSPLSPPLLSAKVSKQSPILNMNEHTQDSPRSPLASRSPESRHHSPSPSPSPSVSVVSSPKRIPEGQSISADDYERGLVLCDNCGEGIPFRDPNSGGFTLKLWDSHRERWFVAFILFVSYVSLTIQFTSLYCI